MLFLDKVPRFVGITFVMIGLLIFYPFSNMIFLSSMANPDFFENIFMTLHVFFFTNWLILNSPGIILVVLGILILRK